MPQIEELRRERAGINQKVQVLAAVETGGGTLTAEQLTEFASLQQQFTDISAKIERLEAAERAAALVAKPVKATQQAPGISIKAEPKQYTGAGMTRLVMSIAAAQGNVQGAAKFAAEELNDQSVSMAINTAAASGGVLIPQNLHSEVIELLPSMKAPTVNELFGGSGYAIETVVPKSDINVLIPALRDAGASDIIELPIAKIVH